MTTAAAVNGAVRRLMGTRDWAWRHTMPEDPAERRAAEILREQAARARRWVEQASEAIGMPVPAGNGTNGPWNRLAVVRDDGRFGLLDIAAGRLAVTDTVVPSYVRRFAMRGHARSPHDAGGSGGCPSGWAQVALTYHMRDDDPVRVQRALPGVTEIVWGYRTCYGECGSRPTCDEYRTEWARVVQQCVAIRETSEPQWEEMPLGMGVDPAVWERYMRSHGLLSTVAPGLMRTRTRGGHWTVQGTQLHYVEVFGVGDARRQAIAALRADYRAWAERETRARMLQAAADWREIAGLPPLTTPGGQRLCTQRGNDRGRPHTDPTLQRAVLGAAAVPSPLPEERQRVLQAAAERFLASDPEAVAASLRSPWGLPGYPDGVNHISYLVEDVRGDVEYREFLEIPGVNDHWQRIREAARALERRLWRGPCPSGPVTEAQVARLREAGYRVEWEAHRHIHAQEDT